MERGGLAVVGLVHETYSREVVALPEERGKGDLKGRDKEREKEESRPATEAKGMKAESEQSRGGATTMRSEA